MQGRYARGAGQEKRARGRERDGYCSTKIYYYTNIYYYTSMYYFTTYATLLTYATLQDHSEALTWLYLGLQAIPKAQYLQPPNMQVTNKVPSSEWGHHLGIFISYESRKV